MVYGSTILSMLNEAFVELHKGATEDLPEVKELQHLRTFGLTLLIPLILTTNANLGSAGT